MIESWFEINGHEHPDAPKVRWGLTKDDVTYKDIFRMPPYRRVDIGFSARLKEEGKESKIPTFNCIKSAWFSLEVFNLLAVNNTISYLWIKDARNVEYGVPNYLTGRRVNAKLVIKF